MNSSGKTPVASDSLKRIDKGKAISSATILRAAGGISSGPDADGKYLAREGPGSRQGPNPKKGESSARRTTFRIHNVSGKERKTLAFKGEEALLLG